MEIAMTAYKDAVRKAGYRYAVTTQRGHVEKGTDPNALRRIPIKLITNPFSFLYKIHTKSEKRKGKQLYSRDHGMNKPAQYLLYAFAVATVLAMSATTIVLALLLLLFYQGSIPEDNPNGRF